MKKLILSVFLVAFTLSSVADAGTREKLQLVQTTPADTSLGLRGLESTHEAWIDLIRSAKEQIDISQFYVAIKEEKDEKIHRNMKRVFSELKKKAKKGVKVRFLVDNKFKKFYPTSYKWVQEIPNVEYREYDISKRTGGINHAKYWIVDNRVAYVGSANFDWRALAHINELGLIFNDEKAVYQLSRIFDFDWKLAKNPRAATHRERAVQPFQAGSDVVHLVASPKALNPKGIDWALAELLDLIKNADESIQIQLLSYKASARDGTKWKTLTYALQKAAKRGVKVHLLVSHWISKKKGMGYLTELASHKNITVKSLTVPKHKSGDIPFARVIHSKYMVVDGDTLWLGTSNWSKDYFFHSRNIELILEEEKLARKVQKHHDKLWNTKYAKEIQ